MKTIKFSGSIRIAAFVLIALTVIVTVAFAGHRWQSLIYGDSQVDEDQSGNNDGGNNEQNGDNSGNNGGNEDIPTVAVPEFTHPLTGVECDESTSSKRPVSFVLDSLAPLYGISYADINIEVPIENGNTRYLMLTTGYSPIGKIGAVSASRKYISFISDLFDAVHIFCGNDDMVSYLESYVPDKDLDLNKNTGFHYTESNEYNYTNGALIGAGIYNSGFDGEFMKAPVRLPFTFVGFGEEAVHGDTLASEVTIPYSENNITSFSYTDGFYTMSKNGAQLTDKVNGETVKYKNVIILFTDTVTYDKQSGTELVPDMTSGGFGICVTGGYARQCMWSINADGALEIKDLQGSLISVQRGTTYIGLFKSSQKDSVKLS